MTIRVRRARKWHSNRFDQQDEEPLATLANLLDLMLVFACGLIAALGEGELSILTTAMSVAFDTTVLGLLVGIIGFVAGRLRRRWYEQTLNLMEANEVDE